MTTPTALSIGGVVPDPRSWCLGCQVSAGPTSTGPRRVRVQARGWEPPVLTGVDWSAPVILAWSTPHETLSVTVQAAPPEFTYDAASGEYGWSLEGIETGTPTGVPGAVSIDGTTYWAAVQVSAPRARARRQVQIRGEGATAPAGSGAVTVTTALFSGTLITLGASVSRDPLTGRVSWTLDGWEAPGGETPLTVAGTSYYGRVEVTVIGPTMQVKTNGAAVVLTAWAKRSVRVSAESAAAPELAPGLVEVTSALYSGQVLQTGVTRQRDPETGLVTWSFEGREP